MTEQRLTWFDRQSLWLDPLIIAGAAWWLYRPLADAAQQQDWASFGFLATVAACVLIVTLPRWLAAFRRARHIPEPPPEPWMRPQLDADGKMQETEPSARNFPVTATITTLFVGVPAVVIGYSAWTSRNYGELLAVGGFAAFWAVNIWLGAVHARRAIRSDERDAAERARREWQPPQASERDPWRPPPTQ